MDLDSLLNLEESFYAEGYQLGVKDGEKAGFTEGSIFAIETAYEKFQEMGRLYGKGIIWAKRLPGNHGLLHSSNPRHLDAVTGRCGQDSDKRLDNFQLPDLPPNPRLEKHLATFLSLVDPLTLSRENTEDAVAEFDERLKKAAAKAKIIEKLLGESSAVSQDEAGGGKSGRARQTDGSGNIEDIGALPARMMQDA
ncbi:hypothetical protein PRK78_001089 [Emydomyces testavorans]|uniref:Essential protein Yae1 N-terminal domain-containing protein n=1 Tax=Emydomyces testavorans TaxID=2070801 RepID=A0AAF0DDD6_9EURO|nr:hypothetical protein PRK78_001089 [Emydomyces testavorans]